VAEFVDIGPRMGHTITHDEDQMLSAAKDFALLEDLWEEHIGEAGKEVWPVCVSFWLRVNGDCFVGDVR
jgi:hypothetical protein